MGGGLPDVVRHATGGRHYCFAVVSFRESFAFFERIRAIVASETGFACIRADDVHGTGEDLREKIHDAIRAAEFVVADISQASPNIFYEVGYSVASGKRLLLLAREKVAIPTDLRGVEVIRYEDTVAGWTQLEKSLRGFLSEMCRRRDTALLRAMMMPAAPGPAFILANPRHGRPGAVFYTRQRRTWGDNLGIVGILSAYGSVYGETVVPELIGTSNAADDLLETDANYYLIGSSKSNKFTGVAMERMQGSGAPGWRFSPCPGEVVAAGEDYREHLTGRLPSGRSYDFNGHDSRPADSPHEDFGLILRGPNPWHPERMMMVLAGTRSLGTGAACLAATRSTLILRVEERLRDAGGLAARDRTLWVLVKGTSSREHHHLDQDAVEVVDAGLCE